MHYGKIAELGDEAEARLESGLSLLDDRLEKFAESTRLNFDRLAKGMARLTSPKPGHAG
jgi:hypothetical protein